MDRQVYIQNEPILSDVLNFMIDSKNEQVRDRAQAFLGYSKEVSYGLTITTGSVFRGGVCANPLDYWKEYSNLHAFNSVVGIEFTNMFWVSPGSAITPNGDLLAINDFSWLFWTPAFFKGSWCVNPNTVAYVKLQYQEASSSLEYDDFGNSHYLHWDRSYGLYADNNLPTSDEVLLATFLGDDLGRITSGSFQDRRSYVTVVTPADSVLLNPTFNPAQALGWDSFEDHAHAYGTGAPSVVNPHALSTTDIGAAPASGSITYNTFSNPVVGTTMVLNTTYQNTYGYTIAVSALCTCTVMENTSNAIESGIQLLVGSSSPPTWVADELRCGVDNGAGTSPMSGSLTHNLLAIVPNNWYYRLSSDFDGWTTNEVSWGDSVSTLYYLTP